MKDASELLVRRLGLVAYASSWEAMKAFTADRTSATPDELWLLQHPPVYTLGLAGRKEHLIDPGAIALVHSDRGGQVTYHGPGQLIAYLLLDLARGRLGIRKLVSILERSVIELLAEHGVKARARADAPGVYVDERKVAALGLRVRHGRCYHGLSLNVDMDLTPFRGIDPCGHPGMAVTQLVELGVDLDVGAAGERLTDHLAGLLGMRARMLAPEDDEQAAGAGTA